MADMSPSRVVRLGRQYEMTRMVFRIHEDRTESVCMIDHGRHMGFLQPSAFQTLEARCRGTGDISKMSDRPGILIVVAERELLRARFTFVDAAQSIRASAGWRWLSIVDGYRDGKATLLRRHIELQPPDTDAGTIIG